MKRAIIKVDADRCNGCGFCVVGCCEGALQLVDNKAVIVNDQYCDGLGVCMRYCMEDAIFLETREAEPYSEEAVLLQLIPKGPMAIRAHIKQLLGVNDLAHAEEGMAYLKEQAIPFSREEDEEEAPTAKRGFLWGKAKAGKPSRSAVPADRPIGVREGETVPFQLSELKHFPIKLPFINPEAGYIRQSHLILAADCTGFACADFHARFLTGKNLAIACPRMDCDQHVHVRKLVEMLDYSLIQSLTVLIMDVPCCEGLVKLVEEARKKAKRFIAVKIITLSLSGVPKNERLI